MNLSDLLQRYAGQSPEPGEGQQLPAATPSVECKGEISRQAINHTDRAAAANNGSNQQYTLLGQAPVQDETSQSVGVKVWSDVLQAAVWVVRDDLPPVEWPHDAPVYTQREVRLLTKIGHDVLQWVNPVKEIFNARVVAAHSATKRTPSSCRPQQNVDL
jgi:hypothetical protein